MKRRLLILGCSARKAPAAGWIPAIDRYDGPLWQTLRASEPTRNRIAVAFLSARYRFRDGSTPIENYNERMSADHADEMIAGGVNTRWPRPPRPRDPDTFGESPAVVITSMSGFGDRPFNDIALVGGHLYLRVMRSFIPEFIRLKAMTEDVTITEINDTIGLMRRRMRQWIEEENPTC
ncbi:MAG: hypothetical protein DI537_17465 [Stutzerimonas stutzeri]|nr:MAG: hypothetical protein DI537_17465 [Stutzerimonas stutzeri]